MMVTMTVTMIDDDGDVAQKNGNENQHNGSDDGRMMIHVMEW